VGLKSFLRAGIERALRWRGYSMVPTTRFDELDYQVRKLRLLQHPLSSHLSDLLGRLGCDAVLDVGANRGQFHDMLRDQAAFRGPIVSYEPNPELAKALADRSAADPLWQVEGVALGDAPGEASLNVTASDDCSSFLAPSSVQPRRLADLNRVVRQVRVPVRTLEGEIRRLREERGFRRLFLKLDTQGWDLHVLRGAGDGLSAVVGAQTEVSLVPIYEGMTDWLTSLRQVRELGFEVTGMFPVAIDPDTHRVIEFDCVLVRPSAAATAAARA
jgi:FkbM family methyltransferase